MKRIQSLPSLPARPRDAHKGTFGRALIIAGSRLMPGASTLATQAAFRSGLGLGTVLTEAEAIPTVASHLQVATYLDWNEAGRRLALEDKLGFDALLTGPGLSMDPPLRLLQDVLNSHDGPEVLDADALNLIAEKKLSVRNKAERIWTPHPGEFQRLTGILPSGEEDRLQAGNQFVKEHGGVLLLKGSQTLIIASDSRYGLNQTGNVGMATGGSGDVLSGILLALLAQGLDAFDSAVLGAHIHGLAGDLAKEVHGEISLIATDLIDYLPQAFAALS